MNRQALGRVLLLLGFAAALALVWETWQPERFAALTFGLAPPATLATFALVLGLAGAVVTRRASTPPPRRAAPPPAPAAAAPEPDPEDSVETIRRRLREAEEKDKDR